MKYFIALDTSFEQGSVGLFSIKNKELNTLDLRSWKVEILAKNKIKKSHSDMLPGLLEDILTQSCMKWEDINFLSVCPGPGRFTGVRIAVSLIKTLSFSLKIPCYQVDSLSVTARSVDKNKLPAAIAFQAFKQMVYYSEVYKTDPFKSSPPEVIPFTEYLEKLKNKKTCWGDVHLFYDIPPEIKQACTFQLAYPCAKKLAELTCFYFTTDRLLPWFRLQPLYLRHQI